MRKIVAAEYLARTLDSFGIEAVFYVPTILSRTLYEMEQSTAIKRVVSHGEKACAYMADGYARASGRPGLCMAQKVGAANLMAGLRDPYLGASPVVAFTGGSYPSSIGLNYYQEIDDAPLFKPVTKYSSTVRDASRLPDLVSHAFRSAIAGKPGPTHLEFEGHFGDVTENQELEAAVPEPLPISVPLYRTKAEDSTVEAAAQVLREAERLVIVAGGGVRASRADSELIALAERLGAPVATSLNGKDTVPGDHPLYVGVVGSYSRASANLTVAEADVVFYVGSQTSSQVTMNWQVPSAGTRIVQLDIEATEIGRHYQETTGLVCDAKVGLRQLLVALNEASPGRLRPWAERASKLVEVWYQSTYSVRNSDATPMRPERLCAELTGCLPSDALLVSDTGHAGMWSGGFIDLLRPGQGYIRAAGSLGWGLPAAIGAQLAQPARPVVLITGDGGLWYHIAELETAARWHIPIVVIINNNRSLNQEIGPYTEAYGGTLHGRHAELWQFTDVDFGRIAEAMGVRGFTVRRAQDLAPAIDQAISARQPAVISVVTDIEVCAPLGVLPSAEAAGLLSADQLQQGR